MRKDRVNRTAFSQISRHTDGDIDIEMLQQKKPDIHLYIIFLLLLAFVSRSQGFTQLAAHLVLPGAAFAVYSYAGRRNAQWLSIISRYLSHTGCLSYQDNYHTPAIYHIYITITHRLSIIST